MWIPHLDSTLIICVMLMHVELSRFFTVYAELYLSRQSYIQQGIFACKTKFHEDSNIFLIENWGLGIFFDWFIDSSLLISLGILIMLYLEPMGCVL